MSTRDSWQHEPPTLRQNSSDETEEHRAAPRLNNIYIPKNRSTGDLLASALRIAEDGKRHSLFEKSPVLPEHEHGLGISGLRRIRQQPTSRAPSRAPTVPSSPTTPFLLPPRAASMTLDPTRAGPPPSPGLKLTEDLTRFPSESLHSFSFAHQSEDALHSRQSVLKRAIDFMRDRLGWGTNHPGVMTARAKVSGDAEVQSMVDLLIRANIVGPGSKNDSASHSNHGPMTGPADLDGRNIFEQAFGPSSDLKEQDGEQRGRRVSSSTNNRWKYGGLKDDRIVEDEAEDAVNDEESESKSTSSHVERASLKRTYTDVNLLTMQSRLTEALAKPYKISTSQSNEQLPELAGLHLTGRPQGYSHSSSSTVHGHNNRWVPASQAVFTTEAASPWTILAANDLACLVFGVKMGEVKKLSMLEFVRTDRRPWLEDRLRSPGFEATVKSRVSSGQTTGTSLSPISPSAMGGGITAALLSKPSWRSKRVPSAEVKKEEPASSRAPKHLHTRSRGVLLCGDIIPIQKRNGVTVTASLWVKEKRGGLIWVLEEIAVDTVLLKLDEDANVVSVGGTPSAIWGQVNALVGKSVQDLIPGLPLIDGFAVDQTALEHSADDKFYAAKQGNGANVPVSVEMNPASRALRVSSFPHIAGIVVLSSASLEVINSNSVFSAQLFGKEDLCGARITELIPRFRTILDLLVEEDEVSLVDGMVIPEHSFRRAGALLAVREGTTDIASMFLATTGLAARHRDGSEITIDVQMRVAQSERHRRDNSRRAEQADVNRDDDDDDDDEAAAGGFEIVYALWITYSRRNHSTLRAESPGSPLTSSRPDTPSHHPSPGQTPRPEISEPSDDDSSEQPAMVEEVSPTLSQKIEEAASQPISQTPPKTAKYESKPIQATLTSTKVTPRKNTKSINDFVILEDMGQGAYGQVKLARYGKSNGKKVVLKYVTKRRILVDTWTRDRRLGTVPLEIHVLDYLRKDGLRHPNIVEMTDFFEDDVNYYIEMVPHGLPGMDLFDYIEMRSTMDEAECRSIFLQVVAALHHLHTKALVVHRDIKDENIILDGQGNVKLIDFGSAAYIKNGPFDVFVGTIDYAAPEVLQGKSYAGKEQDIWALGILLYTLVYKENPFYSIDEILDHELRIPWVLSEANLALIKDMLDRDVSRRVDIEAVQQSEWCLAADDDD